MAAAASARRLLQRRRGGGCRRSHIGAATLSGLPRADVRGEHKLLLPSCADRAASCSACELREDDGRGEHSGAQSSRSCTASATSPTSGLPKSGTLWQRCGARGQGAASGRRSVRDDSQQQQLTAAHRQARTSRALDQPLRRRAGACRHRLQRARVASRRAGARMWARCVVARRSRRPAAYSADIQVWRPLALRHATFCHWAQVGQVAVAPASLRAGLVSTAGGLVSTAAV